MLDPEVFLANPKSQHLELFRGGLEPVHRSTIHLNPLSFGNIARHKIPISKQPVSVFRQWHRWVFSMTLFRPIGIIKCPTSIVGMAMESRSINSNQLVPKILHSAERKRKSWQLGSPTPGPPDLDNGKLRLDIVWKKKSKHTQTSAFQYFPVRRVVFWEDETQSYQTWIATWADWSV